MSHPDYEKYAAELAASKAATEAVQLAVELGVQFPQSTNTDNAISFPHAQALIRRTGNVLDFAEAGLFDLVVHGANCWNTFGSGIAREIRERYPHVADVDAKTTRGDYNKLGNWTSENVIVKNGTVTFDIINAYTQYNMSTGEDVFEYTAFQIILQKLVHQYPTKRFGFPYIGMGLAQGNKNRIMSMIEQFARTIQLSGGSVTLVKFE